MDSLTKGKTKMKFMIRRQEGTVLLIIGIILLALWLLGFASSYTLGGFIYVVLVIGLILVVVSLVTRYRIRR
jgi:hypothetical protein